MHPVVFFFIGCFSRMSVIGVNSRYVALLQKVSTHTCTHVHSRERTHTLMAKGVLTRDTAFLGWQKQWERTVWHVFRKGNYWWLLPGITRGSCVCGLHGAWRQCTSEPRAIWPHSAPVWVHLLAWPWCPRWSHPLPRHEIQGESLFLSFCLCLSLIQCCLSLSHAPLPPPPHPIPILISP